MGKYLVVKTHKGVRKIPFYEILYLIRRGRKIHLSSDQGEIEYAEKLSEIIETLDERFFKALESIYINLDRVKMAEEGRIIFDDESSLLLSRESYVRTKQRLFVYLKTRLNTRDGSK